MAKLRERKELKTELSNVSGRISCYVAEQLKELRTLVDETELSINGMTKVVEFALNEQRDRYIRYLREEKGWSDTEIAKALPLSRSRVSTILDTATRREQGRKEAVRRALRRNRG